MAEHLLMALDVGAEESEPIVFRFDVGQVRITLDDGRELLLERGEWEEMVAEDIVSEYKRRAA